jgi:hypothetical protein
MSFDARIYWPKPAPSVTLTNTFDASSLRYPQEIVQSYTRQGDGSLMLRQTINGVFDSDWYYTIDNRGVCEFRDDYPPKWYTPPWQPKRQVWMVPGKEIFWGAYEQVGSPKGRQCVTSGLFGQWGWQQLAFYEILPSYVTLGGTFSNVLVMEYWQTWSDGVPVGGKMWIAPGIGQVHVEWTKNKIYTGYGMTLKNTSYG